MMSMVMVQTGSKLENKQYVIIAIIAAVAIISTVVIVRFGYIGDLNPRPEGVGEIGSDHVHAKIGIQLNGKFVDMDPGIYPQYANANDYIFLDSVSKGVIHRMAKGATLGMLLDSIGWKLTDDCLVIPENTYNVAGEKLNQTEFCNDGDMKVKLYVRDRISNVGLLVEDPKNYVAQERDRLVLVYDNINTPERSIA